MLIAKRLQQLYAANPKNYPNKLTIELSDWESMSQLLAFWRYVRNTAAGGHSFSIEADREDLGDKAPKVYVDGDGNDKCGRIFLNDKDVTEDK